MSASKMGRGWARLVATTLSLISTGALIKSLHFNLGIVGIIEAFLILGIDYYLSLRVLNTPPKQSGLWKVSAIFGAIVAFVFVVGSNVNLHGFTFIGAWKTWVKIVLTIPLFTVIALWVYTDAIPNFNTWIDVIKCRPLRTRYVFWGAWALILLMWIPTLLATMPGNYAYDAGFQLRHYYNTHNYGLHHPLAHTWLLVMFVMKIGEGMFHSARIGLLLYTVTQMVIFSGALAGIIVLMKQRKIAVLLQGLTLLIFGLSPYFAVMSISATKNTLYSAFLVTLVVMLVQKKWILASFKGNSLLYWSLVTIVSFLSTTFLNQGIYVVVFGLGMGLIFQRVDRIKILGCLIGVVALYAIYTGPVYHTLNLNVEEKRYAETFSVPIMQLANVYENHGNLTSSERKEIRGYMKHLNLYNYSQAMSDPIKDTFNNSRYEENKFRFVKLYLTVGEKNWGKYINAFALLSLGDWYPGFNLPLERTVYPKQYVEYSENLDYKGNTAWYGVRVSPVKMGDELNKFYSHFFINYPDSKIPFIGILNTSGFAMMVWLIFAGWCYLTRKNQYVVVLALVLGLWGTLLLGPVALYRYSFPVIVMIPIMVTIMIGNQQDTNLIKHMDTDEKLIGAERVV